MALAPDTVNWWTAELLHITISLLVLFVTAWLLPGSIIAIMMALTLLSIFAVLKEYWFDLKYEAGETVETSSLDFAFYLIGIGLGISTLWYLKVYFGVPA